MPRKSRTYDSYTNVCTATGRRLWQLEIETIAFGSYEFGEPSSPLMPTPVWKDITEKHFPGCDVFSLKTLVKRTPYTDWRSMRNAITSCGSSVHFVQDGPVWATAANSFDAGIARVIQATAARESAHQFRVITDCS